MSRIVVFGAGGRAGRRVVAEAASRGHRVTAVVRDPNKYDDLASDLITLARGDVTDPRSVANVAAGHDAAVQAAHRADLPSAEFFGGSAKALLAGLADAGVSRLVVIGIGTELETAPGVLLHDTPGFPAEGRTFSLGHVAELEALRVADTDVDWVVLAPPPVVLDDKAERTGQYRIGGIQVLPTEDGAPAFSYADLAVAIVDEIQDPKHHNTLVAVG